LSSLEEISTNDQDCCNVFLRIKLNVKSVWGMHYNGPAIWGGCVTRRKHREGSWYPPAGGPEAVTVQGGYGALFAVMVQALLALRLSRYKFNRSQKTIMLQD